MPTLAAVELHGTQTARSRYQYQFTPKHHGADAGAAQWLPTLSLDEEFSVFDLADRHECSDQDGNLYGVLADEKGNLRYLGIWNQQVAEFPFAPAGVAWHGYPHYPLVELGPENRRGQKGRPAKQVFDKMTRAGIITQRQRMKWTPKTGQSNKLLLAVQERGTHGAETEVPHGGGEGPGGVGGGEGGQDGQ